jgi:predicted amino acid racemase
MNAPRLEIHLGKISRNARLLVRSLARVGIGVTGVTKAALGSAEIANAILNAGVSGLADSRIENIESMRRAGVRGSMTLLRSPMLSQVGRVVAHADVSFNTELDVISELSSAARKLDRKHGIVLMVELGDLREGIMPGDLAGVVRRTLRFPHVVLEGIGANLACLSGVRPDAKNMAELSALADSVDALIGGTLSLVSGGNSGNLQWALSGAPTGRINDLRLGESVLLGREPLGRNPLVAEVIESKTKPSRPSGEIGEAAFGVVGPTLGVGDISQVILALGRQDTDCFGLDAPPGIEILGASSDHIIVNAGDSGLPIGSEVRFQLNYSALVRAMTSPFVNRQFFN